MKKELLLLMLLPFFGFAQNEPGIYCESSTVWNGTSWSNGEPASDKDVIFTANYTQESGTLHACALFVTNGASIIFNTNSNAIIIHNINVENGSFLTFENGSSLIQAENTPNTGSVTIKRKSCKLKLNDFSLWSSPVSGQKLLDFSPETLTTRFYTYSTVDNIYSAVTNPAIQEFENAKGYLIRVPETHPQAPAQWEGQFDGTPNNGDIHIPLSYMGEGKYYNAVGNPYPSAISISKFIEKNQNTIDGEIWLWRKTDDASKSSYATVTKLGFQANDRVIAENGLAIDPFANHSEGVLNIGQAFIVKAKTAEDLIFNNNMRVVENTVSQFGTNGTADEPSGLQASRIWLNVTNSGGVFTQTLIGYTEAATNGYDNGLDGRSLAEGSVTLYSTCSDGKLAIQARSEFDPTDVVSLGFKTNIAGSFELSIDHIDGLFEEGQDIFLRDNTTGTIQNLKEGNYTFTSGTGTFEDRFELIYSTEALGINNPAEINDTVIYSRDMQAKVVSGRSIETVRVYDMLGRVLYQNNQVNSSEFSTPVLNTKEQIVIVQVILDNQQLISKKVMLNNHSS